MNVNDEIGQSRLEPWFHVRMYKALHKPIEDVVQKIFFYTKASAAALRNFEYRFVLIDYGQALCIKTSYIIAERIFCCRKFDPENIETRNSKRSKQKILQLKQNFGKDSGIPDFCKNTARCIHEVIPLAIGQQCDVIPSHIETWILYKAGLTCRYIFYKIDQRTKFRENLISSVYAQRVQGNMTGIYTNSSHFFLEKQSLEHLINIEQLLLEICSKASSMKESKDYGWIKKIVSSLSNSFAQQTDIDKYLQQSHFRSDEERLIGRLQWHRNNGTLPKGLPDPKKVRLTTKNLQTLLDIAMHERIDDLVKIILNKISPQTLTNGFLGIIYALEGKDGISKMLSHLISEFGIKQITDPHLFALAILYAGGEEIADYELDGFGRNKRGEVFSLGKRVIQETLSGKRTWSAIVEMYQHSNLRVGPGGEEAILQQNEAKNHLTRFIEKLIYDMLKDDQLESNTFFKGIRERASQLPVVGVATLCLHSIINGMFYSFEYLIQDKQEDSSFLSWMVKKFSGKKLSHYLASRITDLVYHPSWIVTVMQAIDLFVEKQNFSNDDYDSPKDLRKEVEIDFITTFLFKHFIPKTELNFEEKILPFVEELTSKKILEMLELLMKPSEQPLLEKALVSLTPSIKEITLYNKVVNSFRREKICFEGDQKFWEIFIREALNQLVAAQIKENSKPWNISITSIREKFVDKMLSFSQKELREYLSSINENIPSENPISLNGWEDLYPDTREETQSFVPSLTGNIEWAYGEGKR